jgi:hypothetical protein
MLRYDIAFKLLNIMFLDILEPVVLLNSHHCQILVIVRFSSSLFISSKSSNSPKY